jgi:alkylhydroperoxidase/carboxymuconolactone decarboxylase family protein
VLLRPDRASLARQRAGDDPGRPSRTEETDVSSYYDPQDLARFGSIAEHAPEVGKKFFDWYGAVFADGALSAREKSLVALAVAHAVRCPYCIDAYTQDALSKGWDLDQMTEAVHVAAAIQGGAALVHCMQMHKRAAQVSM